MRSRRHFSSSLCALLPAACLLGSLVHGGEKTAIGEKIVISAPDNDQALPNVRVDERHLSKRFELLDRGSSVSGVVEGASRPAPILRPGLQNNPRLWELFEKKLDQKKNWAYGQGDQWGSQPTLEEMFGVREPDWDAAGQKPASAMSDWFSGRDPSDTRKPSPRKRENNSAEDPNRRDASRHPNGALDKPDKLDNRPAPNSSSTGETTFDPTRGNTAGFGTGAPSGLFNLIPRDSRLTDFTRSGTDPLFNRSPEAQQRSDAFRKQLATSSGINPLVPGFDPINLRVDTTREALNPVTAATPNVGMAVPSANPIDPLRSVAGPPGRGGLSVIEGAGARAVGSSSLAPVVASPSALRPNPAPPVVLEFPKRKL